MYFKVKINNLKKTQVKLPTIEQMRGGAKKNSL